MAKTAIGADRAIMLKHGLGSQAEEVVGGRADMEARKMEILYPLQS